MRKASRLFEIIQILRLSERPVTASGVAARLGVSARSVYRDVAALQAMRVPIEGARGVGYVLRPGFTLPPLMFSIEETESVVLALGLLRRTGDPALKRAALSVRRKLTAAVPPPLRAVLEANTLLAWAAEAPSPEGVDLAEVRGCLREERKLSLRYRDQTGVETDRVVWPVALIYYTETNTIVAWCELRRAIRRFRADRVVAARAIDEAFIGQGERIRAEWIASWRPTA